MNAGDLSGKDAVKRPAEVRGAIVAMKPGNSGGAKGARKANSLGDKSREGNPPLVPETDRQGGKGWWKCHQSERGIGSQGMLEVLERGSKGGGCRGRAKGSAQQPNVLDVLGLFCLEDATSQNSPVSEGSNSLTGEPDAGNLHVRFGGGGGSNQWAVPTPILRKSKRPRANPGPSSASVFNRSARAGGGAA